jgi:hypothetical protein
MFKPMVEGNVSNKYLLICNGHGWITANKEQEDTLTFQMKESCASDYLDDSQSISYPLVA